MGRITKNSKRTRIQNTLKQLRSNYRQALKDDKMQDAFDKLWRNWDNEQAAMIYSKAVSPLDLINLTGVLSNRKKIISLRNKIEELEKDLH